MRVSIKLLGTSINLISSGRRQVSVRLMGLCRLWAGVWSSIKPVIVTGIKDDALY